MSQSANVRPQVWHRHIKEYCLDNDTIVNGIEKSFSQFPSSVVCDLTNITRKNPIFLRIIRSIELKNVTLALQTPIFIQINQFENDEKEIHHNVAFITKLTQITTTPLTFARLIQTSTLLSTTTSTFLATTIIIQNLKNQEITTLATLNDSSIAKFNSVMSVQMADSLDSLLIQLNDSVNNYTILQNLPCADFIKDLTKLGGITFFY